jgi:hypothetical protein
MNARLSGEQNEKGATSMKKGHEQMLRIGSAGRRVMIVLAIAVCSSAALAQTQETSKAPSISDIRLMRKLGDHSRALEYVNALLADGSTPADVRKQAYNELVTMAFVAEGVAGAQSAAHKALMEFPDLKADPAHNPEEIQRIYDDLREKMFGRLHLASDPAGCTVSLKDREIGSTPLEGMYLPLGDHVLLLRRPNYADDTLHVDIAAGAELKRFVDMRLLRDSFKGSKRVRALCPCNTIEARPESLRDWGRSRTGKALSDSAAALCCRHTYTTDSLFNSARGIRAWEIQRSIN